MLSVTILTKNSERSLKKTLDALKEFNEVLIVDTGSRDTTLQIAKAYPNVKIVEIPFQGFGKTHNLSLEHTRFDWVLSIDSDEVLSPELCQEILSLSLQEDTVYRIHRHNYFQGKHITCCSGWYPDAVIRLFNKKKTRFSEDAVHEKVIEQGLKVQTLQAPLLHTPYLQIADFLNKMQTYSTLFAQMNQGKSCSMLSALGHGLFAFFKSYILKRGFLGGSQGLILSFYNAHVTWYKYLKLLEKNKSSKLS